jgi:hypothetical protein
MLGLRWDGVGCSLGIQCLVWGRRGLGHPLIPTGEYTMKMQGALVPPNRADGVSYFLVVSLRLAPWSSRHAQRTRKWQRSGDEGAPSVQEPPPQVRVATSATAALVSSSSAAASPQRNRSERARPAPLRLASACAGAPRPSRRRRSAVYLSILSPARPAPGVGIYGPNNVMCTTLECNPLGHYSI